MTRRPRVYLVPHTHWDREWYLPFQSFRMQLVELIDGVLELMEREPDFRFTLDGQLATVDDYLEVRPEAESRIRALIVSGRLAVGPWQILMDEFLVSGENIVRNLELGRQRGQELGGVMDVGYLPDMFGHAAQMPQILARAGIEHAVVWRGVPAAVAEGHAFLWRAPDGSAVRAEYLPGGYGNAAYVLDEPERLPEKLGVLRAAMEPFFAGDPVLAMYGTDHMAPVPDLTERVAVLPDVELATLADYFDGLRGDGIPSWDGELRSGARANMLMGVTSARIDLKIACARAERMLERYAEPLQTLYGDDWPEPLLRLAWERVIANSAHDSICGCSADEVCDQVLVRFAEAEQIARGLAMRAVSAIARGVDGGAAVVVNPSPHPRTDVVELDFRIPEEWGDVALELGDGTLVATQELSRNTPLLFTTELPGSRVAEEMFRRLHGRELFGRRLNGYSVEHVNGRPRLTFDVDDIADPLWLDVEELQAQVTLATLAEPDERWAVRIVAAPRRRLAAAVAAPALGWTSVRPVPTSAPCDDPVTVTTERISNRQVGLRLADIGRLVDGGDFGDTYNYAPPRVDAVVDEPESVSVEVREAGPLRAVVDVVRTYRWPLRIEPDGSRRSAETALVPVTTRVELRTREPFVRVVISLDNVCEDHRLRLHIPLPRPAESSHAEGQFAVVERGKVVEGGYGEVPLPTFPARGFVDAGGLAVLLDHVTEYELLDGELALTLLRATGLISRNDNPYREDPAGPEVPVPDAQCRRPWRVSFALYPHGGTWLEANVLEQMERYQHSFLAASGTEPGSGRGNGAGLDVKADGVVLSALRRRGDSVELRLVCEQPEPRVARISGRFGDHDVELAPWEIRTLRLSR